MDTERIAAAEAPRGQHSPLRNSILLVSNHRVLTAGWNITTTLWQQRRDFPCCKSTLQSLRCERAAYRNYEFKHYCIFFIKKIQQVEKTDSRL